jgi:hypothetical protein
MKRLPPLLLLATAALAQAPTEHVTVTGTKEPPRLATEHFVQRFTAASPITGKMARWDAGICPITVGLGKKYAAYVTSHLREVAKDAGAPVNPAADCKPNIEIVFTTTPQKLADGIRKQHPFYLGHTSSDAQRDKLATVTHPIQAWYTTAMRDLRGNLLWDSPRIAGSGTEILIPCKGCATGYMNLSSAIGATTVTGGRIADGMRSILYHVIIVAEPAKLREYEVGTLADYIALLALSQVASLDACQPLGSIVNLLVKDCANAPAGLTDSDKSYLRGLYSMSADGNLRTQQDGIAQVMLEEEK